MSCLCDACTCMCIHVLKNEEGVGEVERERDQDGICRRKILHVCIYLDRTCVRFLR